MDSPGIRYTVSKNRFNHRAFQRFVLSQAENTAVSDTVEFINS